MTRVIATGTFDILHPGHVHYLESAAALGDELYVIVAHGSNVTHKRGPFLSGSQRRDVVAALDAVDEAVVGHPNDVFVPISNIEPDVIAIGYDQFHEEAELEDTLRKRGFDCGVVRTQAFENEEYVVSTSAIIERIVEAHDDVSSARTCPIGVRQQPS